MTLPNPTSPTRVAITGASGAYGRTLLAQLRDVPDMTAAVLVDPDGDGARRTVDELGISGSTVVAGIDGVDWADVDVLVEATGNVVAGIAYASAAIEAGTSVVMVSKEVETVAGVALAERASAAGVRYLPGAGDQPANLLRLVSWVERVGLEIVAVGKSSEYDLAFDPEAGTVTQLDVTVDAPALRALLTLDDGPSGVRATLDARAEAVATLRRRAAADHCEMTVVAQHIDAVADVPDLHYPVVRPSELADVYAMREDGGVLEHHRSVDVFSALRLPGEMSFAGGVFVVVRTGDAATWEILRAKGHIVSRSGAYACIAWPYHLMGVETPLTIAAAVDPATPQPRPTQHVVLAGRANRPLAAGTELRVHGHHHEIDGVDPVVLTAGDASAAPFYLAGGGRLRRDVGTGQTITFDDLEGIDEGAAALFRAGVDRT